MGRGSWVRSAAVEVVEDDGTFPVREVHRAAFGDHGRVVADLADDLRRDPSTRSLVAVEDGTAVGNVMFTRNLLDAPERLVDVRVLSPVGVLPGYQRRGIGRELILRGLELMDADGVPLVFLEGDPAYYVRSGFVPAGPLGFRKPSLRIPDAAFQMYRLPAYGPWMTGTLVYREEFWRHDCVGLR